MQLRSCSWPSGDHYAMHLAARVCAHKAHQVHEEERESVAIIIHPHQPVQLRTATVTESACGAQARATQARGLSICLAAVQEPQQQRAEA